MPRWKALPEELDPQIREFASQLRRLVDRSGLNINAVADRTGYSKTSWERYLNGRLLAPRGAVVALAEVTGTPQHHLTTMWELAERAWSRAEMRHDMTMEAIRITQARAALDEPGTAAPDARAGGRSGRSSAGGRRGATGSGARVPTAAGPDAPPRDAAAPGGRGTSAHEAYGQGPVGHATGGHGGGQGPGAYGNDGQGPGTYGNDGHGPGAYGSAGQGPSGYGNAGHGPSGYGSDAYGPGGHDATRPPSVPHQRGSAPGEPRPPQGGQRAGGTAGGKAPGGRRKGLMLAVGAVGALIVVVGAVLLAPGGDKAAKATPPPSAAPTTPAPELPVGVECSGADCAGEDPEAMGCGGEFARTVASAVVGGSKIEVRYSEVCSAAWARLTEAAVGDTVRITAGAGGQDGEVMGDTDAYTPMVAVKKAADAKACATLTSGTEGCTDPGE
ncbi:MULTISPECIES: helix-turn-helix domain-containing protein [unclassified Streptomyces]|uniref:helix-turn-helix domain-containing protein n=1 Tax=unclassified Streptomyces TaxID=2593676 RepID=UPI00379C6982